jgi:hypothetical protein
MKRRLAVLIFVFFAGMILVATEPALLYAGFETGEANVWDPFVNVSFFTLTPTSFSKGPTLAARLSITYTTSYYSYCDNGQYMGTLFYTVSSADQRKIPWNYTSFTPGICFGDIGTPGSGGQGDVIMKFLKTVVLQNFPFAKDAYLKSVSNPWFEDDGFAFAADITIAVKLW